MAERLRQKRQLEKKNKRIKIGDNEEAQVEADDEDLTEEIQTKPLYLQDKVEPEEEKKVEEPKTLFGCSVMPRLKR